MISQPTPELLTAVGHAILRSVAAGQADPLRHAAGALERLADLLPTASAECRLTAVLLAVSDGDPATPAAGADAATPTPTPARRQAKAGKPAKHTRQAKPATPRMDAGGRLLPSKEIGGVAVVSQATARQVLGLACPQMLRLEGQKALARIQENGSRLVWYSTSEVQHLIDLIDRTPPPPP